jgi:hypothetical protein
MPTFYFLGQGFMGGWQLLPDPFQIREGYEIFFRKEM